MKVIVAQSAGFCFGVSRAVNLTKEAAHKGAYALGNVIHNADVIAMLEQRGLVTVKDPADVPPGSTAVIRAHGACRSVYEELAAKNAEWVDTTCPFVRRIHRIVEEAALNKQPVLIIGDANHPEVLAIADRAYEATILSNPSDWPSLLAINPSWRTDPLCVVAQTTLDRTAWEFCVNAIKKECTNAQIFDTICNATDTRQKEAQTLAEQADVMLVVGDPQSANTRRLFELCRARCKETYFIAGADELSDEFCESIRTRPGILGITAGASTPVWKIKEVNNKMAEETTMVEGNENFAEMVEQSIKTLHTGEKVTGIVTRITSTDIHVDLGTKHAGFIPLSEYSDDPSVKPEDELTIGDEIEVFVTKVNDQEGIVTLSKKRVDAQRGWDSIDEARVERALLEGTIVEENKGGVVALVNGVRVFIPASHTGLPREASMTELVKQNVTLRIIEVNRQKRRVIGSIRYANEDLRKLAAAALWETLAVGNEYDGVVKSLTSFGAFIDIGGADGMAHVTELSWSHVKNPADVLSVGEKVRVRVIGLDPEKKKISLTLKDEKDNPWMKFINTFQVGDITDVKVVKLMPFGAFAEVLPGVDGLIHISQLADRRIARPADVVSEGDVVRAKILAIDHERQKISLSVRAVLEEGENVFVDEVEVE